MKSVGTAKKYYDLSLEVYHLRKGELGDNSYAEVIVRNNSITFRKNAGAGAYETLGGGGVMGAIVSGRCVERPGSSGSSCQLDLTVGQKPRAYPWTARSPTRPAGAAAWLQLAHGLAESVCCAVVLDRLDDARPMPAPAPWCGPRAWATNYPIAA